ncbi:unnamed protein product [Rotaria socialis]|uniref:Glycoside hydrolase 35 catalytic domain-containing protein n=2 Tax=Rotaria socialis TaxID=392032 RepID=A0A817SKA2_9BILA|nr:unnamed protein product [Rotaria socialis]
MKLWSRRINRMSYHRRFFVICGYLTILGISIYFLKAFVSPVVYLSTLVLDNERHLFIRPFNDKNRNREHLLPFRILSGSLHYFRVLPQSWSDRIKKMKAAGLNTIETYVPWNLHEPQRGNYQFGEGLTDLVSFLKLIYEHEMFTIIRPSGYICAEWDWGGLPSWLLRDETMRVRSIHPGFLEALQNYYSRLLPILAEYQYNRHGAGSIIAFQIENEYGSYDSLTIYVEDLNEKTLFAARHIYNLKLGSSLRSIDPKIFVLLSRQLHHLDLSDISISQMKSDSRCHLNKYRYS